VAKQEKASLEMSCAFNEDEDNANQDGEIVETN